MNVQFRENKIPTTLVSIKSTYKHHIRTYTWHMTLLWCCSHHTRIRVWAFVATWCTSHELNMVAFDFIGTKENYVHVTLAWKFHESCPNSPMDLIYFDLLFFFFSAQMKCEYQKSIIIGSKKLISKINTKLYKHAFAIYLPQQSVLCFISNCLSFYLFDVHV